MVLESLVLIGLRIFLLLGCRKYLLNVLYSDLKNLSTESPGEDIELDTLPPPSTHTPKSVVQTDNALLHGIIARNLFSWTFAECCMLFILLVLQGMNVLSPSARLVNWQFSLFFLVLTIIVTIPASFSLLLALGNAERVTFRRFCGPRALLNLIPVAFFVFALSKIPLPATLATSDAATVIVSRLIVVGTVFLGALSGFGAISNTWPFLPFLSRGQSTPSEQDILIAEQALSTMQNDLRQRRLAADRRAVGDNQQSWISRVGTSFRGGDDASQEIRGLESLEYQMNKNLADLRQRRDTGVYSRTFRGKVAATLGKLFAIYCITRIFSCLYNVAFLPATRSSSNMNYSDLLANVLAYGFSRISTTSVPMESVANFSRQLSFALVGIIILTSIRLVLRGVTQLLQVTSRSLGASLMLLFLAQVMAIYLLSTIIQMRSSFPPPPSTPDHEAVNLFSTVPEYEVFGSLFDWAFLLTATASAIVRWGASKVTGFDDDT